jgi:hypothetical protein
LRLQDHYNIERAAVINLVLKFNHFLFCIDLGWLVEGGGRFGALHEIMVQLDARQPERFDLQIKS